MRINSIKILKNIGISLLQLCLIVVFSIFVFYIGKNILTDVNSEYSEYKSIRSLDNYGVSSVALFKRTDTSFNYYEYSVDSKNYTLSIPANEQQSIDNELCILYDKLDPNLVVEETKINDINGFYTDMLKSISLIYVYVLLCVIILGVFWLGLDLIKYNKLLWKENV